MLCVRVWYLNKVASVLGEKDPNRFYSGKKSASASSKGGGRLRPKDTNGASDVQGCSAEGGAEECAGGDAAGASAPATAATTAPPSIPVPKSTYVKPESKIIIGPGGAKWEIFRMANGEWPNTAHP